MILRWLLACLMASHFSLALAESENQNDPWRLLDKAAHAARDLSYKGIFVYQSGSNSRSIEITHMNAGQGEYSRVVMLDGLPQEVLSQGSDIVIFSPRDEKVVIEKRRGKNLFPALLTGQSGYGQGELRGPRFRPGTCGGQGGCPRPARAAR